MDSRKIVSIILCVGGVILLLLSLFADVIGIGTHPDFGGSQILGVVVGAVAALVGLFLLLRKK